MPDSKIDDLEEGSFYMIVSKQQPKETDEVTVPCAIQQGPMGVAMARVELPSRFFVVNDDVIHILIAKLLPWVAVKQVCPKAAISHKYTYLVDSRAFLFYEVADGAVGRITQADVDYTEPATINLPKIQFFNPLSGDGRGNDELSQEN